MILELSDQDNVALEEISKILERHPDLKLIEMVVLLFTAGNERARKKHDVRISLLILHRVVSFLQL